MDTLEELFEERKKILSAIYQAASRQNTNLVISESGKLERVEHLIRRQMQISSELEELRNDGTAMTDMEQRDSTIDREPRSVTAASREFGEEIRQKFLNKMTKQGIDLQPVKGKTIYRTHSGKRVGIAVATERQPNRWFLGLPSGAFDHAILLCHREKKEMIEFLLTEEFFKKYGKSMSESKGQIKFNVVQRGSRVLLRVPETDGISSASFPSDYSFLS